MNAIRKIFITASLLGGSAGAFAQANSWVFSPNVMFNANNGTASYFPAGSGITGCSGTGHTYGVVSPAASTTPYFAFSGCGIYNASGTSVGNGVYSNVFAVPGSCKQYYAVGWEYVWGPPHGNGLFLHELDASDPANVYETTSVGLINDGYMHSGASVVVAPLASDGSRKIYAASDNTLKSWTVSPTGVISGGTTIATMSSAIESRLPMEISPDGKTLFLLNSGDLMQYDIASGTFTTLYSFGSLIVSGMEYVPALNRLYVSYHTWNGLAIGGFGYIDVASPAGIVNALGSFPVPYAFGFSEIERAKNGKLYFAFNPLYGPDSYGYFTVSSPGTLYSLDPVSGTLSQVSIGSTPVAVNDYDGNWGYFIQNQIDGENYNATTYTLPYPGISLNGHAPVLVTEVPDVWRCNGNSVLALKATMSNSFYSSYDLKVEEGSVTFAPPIHQPVFTPASGGTYTYGPVNTSQTQDSLNLLSLFPALDTYYSYIRVTYTVYGCGGSRSTSYIYRILSAESTIDFTMQAPPGASCPGGGSQPRNPTPAFAAHGPVTAPFCDLGWLGAASCGILGFNATTVGVSSPQYNVLIENVSAGDTISSTNYSVLPASGPFSSLASGYFINNYAAIKGSAIFRVTVSLVTPECGKDSNISYFKIIDGGPAFSAGNYFREYGTESLLQAERVNVFPNPALDKVHVTWMAGSRNTGQAVITLYDALGKTVLRRELDQYVGANDVVVDLTALSPGIYHYTLHSAQGDTQGKLVKQ